MRHSAKLRIAAWLRRLADWFDPPIPTVVDGLMPIIRALVAEAEKLPNKGPIKEVLVMKAFERTKPGYSRLDIKDAINRAVRELRAARSG